MPRICSLHTQTGRSGSSQSTGILFDTCWLPPTNLLLPFCIYVSSQYPHSTFQTPWHLPILKFLKQHLGDPSPKLPVASPGSLGAGSETEAAPAGHGDLPTEQDVLQLPTSLTPAGLRRSWRLQGAELRSTGLGCHLAVTQQQQGHTDSSAEIRLLLQPG